MAQKRFVSSPLLTPKPMSVVPRPCTRSCIPFHAAPIPAPGPGRLSMMDASSFRKRPQIGLERRELRREAKGDVYRGSCTYKHGEWVTGRREGRGGWVDEVERSWSRRAQMRTLRNLEPTPLCLSTRSKHLLNAANQAKKNVQRSPEYCKVGSGSEVFPCRG